jgi:HPt (histidine-containing phosphotransfer) domain-containing protein
LPADRWDDAGFEALHRMVHSLTGSGKTFGFAALSDAARSLEDSLRPLADAKIVLNENQRSAIQALLRELRATVASKDVSDTRA